MRGRTRAPKYMPTSDERILTDLEKATKENECAYTDMQTICEEYNVALKDGQNLIEAIIDLVNSIAYHPKKYDDQIEKIKASKIEHLTIEQYKTEERKALIDGGLLAAAFAAAGAAFATFDRRKKSGIIGAIIALLGLILGGVFTWYKKRKAKQQAMEAINKLYADTFSLQQSHAKVLSALQQIKPTTDNLRTLFKECEQFRGLDKLSILPLAESRKKLSQLVTNTASFAKLLSQKV